MKYIKAYTREHNEPDRESSHRLKQLVVHTVPLFGNGRLISELIMEFVNQLFKSWLEMNTNSDSHITGCED